MHSLSLQTRRCLRKGRFSYWIPSSGMSGISLNLSNKYGLPSRTRWSCSLRCGCYNLSSPPSQSYCVAQLSESQFRLNAILAEARASAQRTLDTAQELSLLRHSLADELAFLSSTLVSSMSDVNTEPTLLEEIETFHRSLKELDSVKGYVQVIYHALKLR